MARVRIVLLVLLLLALAACSSPAPELQVTLVGLDGTSHTLSGAEAVKEIPVAKVLHMPKEIKGKPVPSFSPEDPSKPFRPGLVLPSDLKMSDAPRTIRI